MTTLDAIDAIGAENDPVLRNLLITQTYHELSNRLQQPFGDNATWCAFAVWASKTAGQSIRKEELARALRDLTDGDHRVAPTPDDLRAAGVLAAAGAEGFADMTGFRVGSVDPITLYHRSVDHASQVLGDGNALVFREVAGPFAALADAADRGRTGRAAWTPIKRALNEAALFHAPFAGSCDPGLLEEAFRAYVEAMDSSDTRRAAQLVMLGNSLVVLHEQQRLDPAVNEATDAPLFSEQRPTLAHRWEPPAFLRLVGAWHETLDRWWGRVITAHLMRLQTPGGLLRLDEDIPGCPPFPADLEQLEHPRLLGVIESWDRTGGAGVGCGARDWRQIQERMTFILTLFRSKQKAAELLSPPFNADQVAALRERRVPKGPL